MDPVAENVIFTLDQLDDWKMLHWTADTIAVTLEQIITGAHYARPPQYRVFKLVPASATVISFNWDGLAKRFCPQHTVLHPHGYVLPRPLSEDDLREILDWTQFGEHSDGKWWFENPLVMIGEESGDTTRAAREEVFKTLREATGVVIIGYSFGFGSLLDYDRVWRELFVEAMRINSAPIHLVLPAPRDLWGAVVESVGRETNVFCWPLSWHAFSRVLLRVARNQRISSVSELIPFAREICACYNTLVSDS